MGPVAEVSRAPPEERGRTPAEKRGFRFLSLGKRQDYLMSLPDTWTLPPFSEVWVHYVCGPRTPLSNMPGESAAGVPGAQAEKHQSFSLQGTVSLRPAAS